MHGRSVIRFIDVVERFEKAARKVEAARTPRQSKRAWKQFTRMWTSSSFADRNAWQTAQVQ